MRACPNCNYAAPFTAPFHTMNKKKIVGRKAAPAEDAPASKKSKTTVKQPKTLLDAVVVAVTSLGGKGSVENAISLPALKKQLAASRGMDFDKRLRRTS